MTAPAPTIPGNTTPIRQTTNTANSAQSAGALFALSSSEGALFADLLSVVETASVTPAGESVPEATPATAQDELKSERDEEEEPEGEEEGASESAETQEGGSGASVERGDAASGLPMTIHSLNLLLLRGDGNRAAAAPSESRGASRVSRQDPNSGKGRETGDSPAADGRGTSQETPAAVEKAKEVAPSPLAALTKAGESAQSTLIGAKAPAEGGGSAPASQGNPEPVRAIGALTTIAVASPAANGTAREARSSGGGAQAPIPGINGAQGAQGTRGIVRNLRAADAPMLQTTTQARAEAFQAQIARGLAAAVENGRGTLTLRLKPEALGQVQIKVSMKDGVLNARFEAQTSEARDLLLSTSGELRRSLEAAGLSVERIEASVSPELREQPPGEATTNGDVPSPRDGSNTAQGEGSPGRNDSGPYSGRRGTDAASTDQSDGAAEPLAEGVEWLVLGLDTVA